MTGEARTSPGEARAPWWQSGIIYQIYPRSFQDSNGDGIGDLEGITNRLDHCTDLGIDAVWLSPIFPSPMADFGYDVADYIGIDPLFGTLADFDRMQLEVKRRGLHLLLDYVPNHTSDRHPWFEASRSGPTNPYRDWYLWRDAAPDGGPPNNWLSHFGGSAWTWDEQSKQYYYHSFLSAQPDLNWRNPDVVAAMHEVLRFWLRKGVDGFRIDVLWLLIKDDQWRDNPPDPAYRTGMPAFRSQLALYTADRPEVQAVVAGLRRVVDEFDDRVLIGEIYLPLDRLVAYYGERLDGVQMPFNFHLLSCPWNGEEIGSLIERYESALPHRAWPNWVLANHDRPRIASRVGAAQTRVAATLLLTLRGTPTLYYGDELGMSDTVIPSDKIQDPLEKNVPGVGLGRDPCRTPMQWDGSPGAGFSEVTPWLPIPADAQRLNVEDEAQDPGSLLRLYRRLISLRREHSALSIGDYTTVSASPAVLVYVRSTAAQRVLIALNFTPTEQTLELPAGWASARVLLSTHAVPHAAAMPDHLRANEAVILILA